jgi:hypothetical protein
MRQEVYFINQNIRPSRFGLSGVTLCIKELS